MGEKFRGFEVNYYGGYAPSRRHILFQRYLFEHDNPDEAKRLEIFTTAMQTCLVLIVLRFYS